MHDVQRLTHRDAAARTFPTTKHYILANEEVEEKWINLSMLLDSESSISTTPICWCTPPITVACKWPDFRQPWPSSPRWCFPGRAHNTA